MQLEEKSDLENKSHIRLLWELCVQAVISCAATCNL